jgi:hypothetical protein
MIVRPVTLLILALALWCGIVLIIKNFDLIRAGGG